MSMQRYDYVPLKATTTSEGFLVDSPIVSRIGIQEYTRADGSIIRELRLPEDVFHPDSLASMKAKPITIDHLGGIVNSDTANRVTIGAVLSEGRQHTDGVQLDVVIHSPNKLDGRREISLGYSCVLDETPGIWNGQVYDAIQRDIKVNHLSIVKRGRAGGIAKLNLDSNEELDDNDFSTKEQHNMTIKVKLDNGIEYEALPEVAAELTKLRSDALGFATKLDAIPTMQANIDTLQAKVDGIDALVKEAKEAGRTDALVHLTLEAYADKFKVDHKDKSDREVKEAVIKSVRKDADLTDKSDAYIDAAFDIALDTGNMASQRESVNTKTDEVKTDAKSAYAAYMASLVNKESK